VNFQGEGICQLVHRPTQRWSRLGSGRPSLLVEPVQRSQHRSQILGELYKVGIVLLAFQVGKVVVELARQGR
jgi:hypothetical protein